MLGGATDPTLDLLVLGPWTLTVDGEPLDIGRRQVRSLLTRLALSDDPVGVDPLVDLLWPDDLPGDPTAALRVVVSRARRSLGDAADRIALAGDRFAFDATSDARRFLDIAARPSADVRGRSPERVDELRGALDLWRGRPFEGLDPHPDFDADARRLDAARTSARRELLESLTELGRFDEVIEIVEPLVGEHPDREPEAILLARALGATGRRRDALAVLDDVRRGLVTSGFAPGRRLREIEAEILDGAVDLHEAPTEASDDRLLLGRSDELDRLGASRLAPIVVITGEPGIGKTTLLEAAAERWMIAGLRVFQVEAPTSPTALMEPVARLVEQLLDDRGIGDRSHGGDRSDGDLPADDRGVLGVILPQRVGSATGAWASGRDELVEGLVDMLCSLLDDQTIVSVDDAQWLDSLSADVLRRCATVAAARFVFAARSGSTPIGFDDAEHLELAPLPIEVVDDWVRKEVGESDLAQVRLLHERTGGNPLFVRLLVDLLVDEVSDDELPPTVLATVRRRVDSLSPAARRLVATAAVIGPVVPLHLIREIVDAPHDALIEAARAGLVVIDHDELRFVHGLVADAVAQLQGEGARLALHDAAAQAAIGAGRPALEYWRHCVATAMLDPLRARRAIAEAARTYAGAYAWDEALECLAAGHVLPSGGDPGCRPYDLMTIEGRALFMVGRPEGAEVLHDAIGLARSAGDDVAEVRAITELSHRGCYALLGLDPEPILPLIERGMALDAGADVRAELAASAARSLGYSPHHRAGQEHFRTAFSERDGISDRRARWTLLRNAEYGLSHPADLDDAERACDLMDREMGHNVEIRFLVAWTRYRQAIMRGDAARLLEARDAALAAENAALASTEPLAYGHTYAITVQRAWLESGFELLCGDVDAAERWANRSLELGEEVLAKQPDDYGRPWIMLSYGSLLVGIRHRQSRLAELAPLVNDVAPLVPAWRSAVAATKLAAGDVDEAVRVLREVAADGFSGVAPDQSYTGALWLLAEPAAHLLDRAEIDALYQLISPWADRFSWTGTFSLGPMSTAAAVLADALGHADDARSFRHRADEQTARLRAALRDR